eukprot:6214165-Pleurochrysis_carterae.AAC.1
MLQCDGARDCVGRKGKLVVFSAAQDNGETHLRRDAHFILCPERECGKNAADPLGKPSESDERMRR